MPPSLSFVPVPKRQEHDHVVGRRVGRFANRICTFQAEHVAMFVAPLEWNAPD